MIDDKTLSEIVKRVTEVSNINKIYLVGSQASESSGEESDIDLIIIKDTLEERLKRSIEFQRKLIGIKVPVDIMVYTNEEFEFGKQVKNSFLYNAMSQSRLLYEYK